jgi:hypothetical protein
MSKLMDRHGYGYLYWNGLNCTATLLPSFHFEQIDYEVIILLVELG